MDPRPIDDMGRFLSDKLLKENETLKPYRLELLDAVVKCLQKSRVEFWMSDGTLLGSWRENRMIPHDCDIDLAIKEDDMSRLDLSDIPYWMSVVHKPNQRATMDKNHSFSESRDVCKTIVFRHNMAPEFSFKDDLQVSGAELDLYSFRLLRNGLWTKNDKRFDQSWDDSVLFPLRTYKFEWRNLPGPQKPREYLEILYGYIGHDAVWDEKKKRYTSSKESSSPSLDE